MKSLYEDLIKVDMKALNEALENFTTKTHELLPKIPNRASGSQIRAMLRNAGVTDDEIKYMKLGSVLDKDVVTKKEIEDHLEQKGVPLQVFDYTKERGERYKQYALRGGRNYGEKLVNFKPENKKMEYRWDKIPEDEFDASNVEAEWRMYHPKDTHSKYSVRGQGLAQVYVESKDGKKTLTGRVRNESEASCEWQPWNYVFVKQVDDDTLEPIVKQAMLACEINSGSLEDDGYRSSHWQDVKNPVFHIRHQEFTDADGKNLWLIEEIQSDLHQAARKKGYKGSFKAEVRHVPSEGETHPYHVYIGGEKVSGHKDEESAKAGATDIETRWNQNNGLLDAPMKKSWEENAFKYALQQAVKAGADRIGWVTGKISADRYDLSKHIGSVYYNQDTEELRAYKPAESPQAFNGGLAFERTNVKPEDLPDYIGKEAAEKLMAAPIASRGGRTIGGLDLKVGGEGMKAAYDQRIPSIAKKIAKAGGSTVGKVALKGAKKQKKEDYRRKVSPITSENMKRAANRIRDHKSGVESNKDWDNKEAKKFDDLVERLCSNLEGGMEGGTQSYLPLAGSNLEDMFEIESWLFGNAPATQKAIEIIVSSFGWDVDFADDDADPSGIAQIMKNYDKHVRDESEESHEVWYMDITDGIKALVQKGLRLTFESETPKKDWWVI
jgi:hypothetical protein